MSTSKSAWTQRERNAAGFFGAKRQPCSGSGGRSDQTRSDSTHERLFIETKLRTTHTVRTLYDQTVEHAKKEDKIPVLCLADKNRPGWLVVLREHDLLAIANERLIALAKQHQGDNEDADSHGGKTETSGGPEAA